MQVGGERGARTHGASQLRIHELVPYQIMPLQEPDMCLEKQRKKHGAVCIMQLLQSAAAGLGTLQRSMSHSEVMVDRVKRGGIQRDESRMGRQNGEDAFHNGQGV